MITLAILLGMMIWGLLEGWREALYYHFKSGARMGNLAYSINEHPMFATQRALVFGLQLLVIYSICGNLINASCMVIGSMLSFPFFHDSEYYYIRHKYDSAIYQKGWMDEETGSTALMNFNFPVRTSMFVIGLAIQICMQLCFA